MDNKELLKYIRLFRDKANADKLIVFVGAGVSCNVSGMPSWLQLIQKMANAITYSKCSNCRHKKSKCEENCDFKDDYSQEEFLKIPQYVYNQDAKLYAAIIRDNINDLEIDAPLSKAIFSMNPAHIITTNYDKLIESCSDVRRDNYQVIVQDKDLLVSEKNKYIIKMHGDITNLDTIVLKESDYLEYSQRHVLIEMFVKALLADHTILFLGYSLNDYNIKLIISWINFIRSQSRVLDSNPKIGFIVLDSENISEAEINYFENNNIGVINLRNMPLIDKIPDELGNEVGRRLFGFCHTISDTSNEKYLGQSLMYDDVIDFLMSFRFVDCDYICDNLYLGTHTLDEQELVLRIDSNFDALVEYMKSSSRNASILNGLFIDAGITTISLRSSGSSQRRDKYVLQDVLNSLLKNQYYQLYINNQYQKLEQACDATAENDWREPCFYKTLICGYTHPIFHRYSIIPLSQMTIEEKVAYLFNNAVLEAQKTYKYGSQQVQQYINGIPDQRQREGFKQYLDIFEGNTRKLMKAKEALAKLKEQYKGNNTFIGCSSLGELFKVKRIALEQYQFYYCNNLFYIGFSDIKFMLKVYAEAIICTNGESGFPQKTVWGFASPKSKYPIGVAEFDILTKMLSIKELCEFLEQYHVSTLNMNDDMVDFCIGCFTNIAQSIIELRMFNRFLNASSTLVNSITCLSCIELTDSQKLQVSNAINLLLQNKAFSEYFFSVDFPEWRKSATLLLRLMKQLSIPPNWDGIKNLLNNPKLQEYIINSNFHVLQDIVLCLVGKDSSEEEQKTVKEFILKFPEEMQSKIIRLMKKSIIDETIKAEFKTFISHSFSKLDSNDILDFAFDEWLELSSEQIEKILNDALIIKKSQTSGVKCFPDPLEQQLELIYLLYVTDTIKDISVLQPLSGQSDFLKFFFDDPNLDYCKIDFSNYMWQNIVSTPKFIEKFKDHKDEIIPHIQKRIEIDEATEFERKLLYGVLLDKVF